MGKPFKTLVTVVRPRQWQYRKEEAYKIYLGGGGKRTCLRPECEHEGKGTGDIA